jgi:hypothetical protein
MGQTARLNRIYFERKYTYLQANLYVFHVKEKIPSFRLRFLRGTPSSNVCGKHDNIGSFDVPSLVEGRF